MSAGSVDAGVDELRLEGFRVTVARALRPADPALAVARLTDPGAARRTLHWGRNYLYTMGLELPTGRLEVVVKQFRNEGLRARLKRRLAGSKAEKSWRVAHALVAAGFATPRPVMVIESERPDGPSFYVSELVEHDFEARYYFRALNAGREAELYPELPPARLLGRLGRTARRLHDAGFVYRDLSAGNVLVRLDGGEPELFLVDLNRVRTGQRPGVLRRTRDLCRLPIHRPVHQELLLRAYWGEAARWFGLRRRLYLLHHHAFLFRNRAKDAVRRPFRELKRLLVGRGTHAHIPPAPEGASARDKVVWDHLSDQPHQHAGKVERLRVRVADAGAHGEALAAAVASGPRVWRRYRELDGELYRRPVPWQGAGVAVRPWERDPEALVAALDDLGLGRVLIRLHPWQEEHAAELELARELAARGHELSFALPQNRDLVRDLPRWRAAVERIADLFLPLGRAFQVGQAINRSKWGVWNYREYLELVAVASEVLRREPEVQILGPAVIDFEYQAAAAVLNMRHAGVHFDAVSSLLYVDRRGAPENRQLGFDTVGKVVLLRALAETGANCAPRCWITEVNWPLWEGPHSPAGRDVAVDEEAQADYLARYYLLALGTGLVERVFWWQAIARGYGLIDPGEGGELRRRPSFRALATLERELGGSTFHGPVEAPPPAWLYRFSGAGGADGGELVVGWSSGEPARVRLPGTVVGAVGRGGEEVPVAVGEEVAVTGSPRYFRLRG